MYGGKMYMYDSSYQLGDGLIDWSLQAPVVQRVDNVIQLDQQIAIQWIKCTVTNPFYPLQDKVNFSLNAGQWGHSSHMLVVGSHPVSLTQK